MDSLSAKVTQYIPPWKSPYIIGVAGYSGSGKTTVAQHIIEEINEPWTVLLSLDNFYKPLSPEESARAFRNEYDFDEPNALDLDLMRQCVKSLKEGKKTEIPVYSFTLHSRTDQKICIYGSNVIIIEGLYTLFDEEINKYMDFKVYVDADLDICFSRRLLRDIVERGRDLGGIIKQWDTFVKPNSVRYVRPTMQSADVIIPRGADNKIALSILIKHIRRQLDEKSREHVRQLQALGKVIRPIDTAKLHVLPATNQLKVIKTILLNKDTSAHEFIFYFDRVASLLITHALDYIEYLPGPHITTPINAVVKETRYIRGEIIAVDIIRAGDCFIPSLKKTVPGIRVGKLLIQSDSRTGEPHLHTEHLPPIHGDCNVLLFDAQVISGAAATMAVKVLLDYGVREDRIVLCTLLATEVGVRRIQNAFQNVHIVVGSIGTSSADSGKDSDSEWWMANRFIDTRYFGT